MPRDPRWAVVARNTLSARVLITVTLTAFPALLVGGLPSLLWEPLGYAAVPIALVTMAAVWTALAVGPAVHCPECGKRVKLGHQRCHHCLTPVA